MSIKAMKRNFGHNKKAMMTTIIVCVLIAIIAIIVAAYAGKKVQEKKAAEEKASVQLNEAGGQIDDIDWNTVIGYDADGNPIYKSFGKVPGITGYDMFGAPIPEQDATGTSQDGLPIYGGYSGITEAMNRNKGKGDSDVNWDKIIGYDMNKNPIYASLSGDESIIGYDANGNPIYVSEVEATGETISGLPVYNYSAIDHAKQRGAESTADVSERMKDLQDKNEELQKQVADLRQRASKKADINGDTSAKDIADKKALYDQVVSLTDQLSKSTDKINSLNKQIEENKNKKSSSAVSGDSGATSDMIAKVNSLQSEMDELKRNMNKMDSELDKKDRQITTLKNQNDKLSSAKDDADDEAYDAKKALETAKSELDAQREATDAGNTTIDKLTSEINAKNVEIELLKKNKDELENKVKSQDDEKNTKLKALQSKLDAAQKELKEAEDTLKDYQKGVAGTKFTVTFDPQSGDTENAISYSLKAGQTCIVPVTSRRGYTFNGWGKKKDAAAVSYKGGETYTMPKAYTTYYAKWTPVTYKISYDYGVSDDSLTDKGAETASYTIETDTFRLNTPARTGYDFLGWTDENGNQLRSIVKGENARDLSLTASWGKTAYNIKYVLSDGQSSGTNPASFIDTDILLSLNSASQDGHYFRGWYEKKDFSGEKVDAIKEKRDYTLYPKFDTIVSVPDKKTVTYTYNAKAKKPVAQIFYDGITGITVKDNVQTEAGSYSASLTPMPGYCWADGTTDSKSVDYEILPAEASYQMATGQSFTYDGSEHEITYSDLVGCFAGGDIKKTDAGSYMTEFTLLDNKNWKWKDGLTGKVNWSIVGSKVAIPVPYDTLIYNGSSQAGFTIPSLIGEDNIMISGNPVNETDAKTYYTTLKLPKNYTWNDDTTEDKTIEWKISPKSLQSDDIILTYPEFVTSAGVQNEAKYTYDGKEHFPEVIVKDGDIKLKKDTDYTISKGESFDDKNCGNLNPAIIGKGNYSDYKIFSYSIIQKESSIKIDDEKDNKSIFDRIYAFFFPEDRKFAVSGNFDGEISISSSDTDVLNTSYSINDGERGGFNRTGTLTLKPYGTGNAVLTIRNDNNKNFTNFGEKKVDVTVSAGSITMATTSPSGTQSFTYDGTAHSFSVQPNKIKVKGSDGELTDGDATVSYRVKRTGATDYVKNSSTDPDGWTTTVPTFTNVSDSGTVEWKIEDKNYEKQSGNFDVQINKAASYWNTKPTGDTSFTAGTPVGGEAWYKIAGGDWQKASKFTAPSTACTVYYKIVGDGNHLDLDEDEKVLINPVTRHDSTLDSLYSNGLGGHQWYVSGYVTESRGYITGVFYRDGGLSNYIVHFSDGSDDNFDGDQSVYATY